MSGHCWWCGLVVRPWEEPVTGHRHAHGGSVHTLHGACAAEMRTAQLIDRWTFERFEQLVLALGVG